MASSRVRSLAGPDIPTADTWEGRFTRALVDLDAVAENVRSLRDLAPRSELMVVVKANAYGHGSTWIAREALMAGASWIGVYAVQEGVELRRAGIRAPVLVFGSYGHDEALALVEHDLTGTVTSARDAGRLNDAASGRELDVHIKIDTGMHRAGASLPEILDVAREVARLPGLRLRGAYSHFAGADEPDLTSARAQLQRLQDAFALLEQAGHEIELRHIANSAGCIALPESHLDMVRCGIATYGYFPAPDMTRNLTLRPALSLVSVITRVHTVPPGEGVGYGFEFRRTAPTRIALVPIGYGDGLPRSLGWGRGTVLIRGRHAPIVGRVSMDQITAEVSEIADVQEGDEVVLLGNSDGVGQDADAVAERAGTISYHILSSLLPRVPRVYLRKGRVVGSG